MLRRVTTVFVLLSCAALSQQPDGYIIKDNVELVMLDASVRDSSGAYVSGLSKDNFRVLDDRKPQKLLNFAAIDAPVTLGLIVDNSGSMRSKRPEVVSAGLQFAKSSNPQDEFFVVNFNDHVYSGMPANAPFTDKLHILRSALYMGTPVGRTALYDAIAFGLKQLEDGHREVRTLIVVSDGGDNVSKLDLAQLIRLIDSSRATIYTIGLIDPDDNDLNPGVLKKIAAVSGGEYFQPENLAGISHVFAAISKDIRSRYSFGFHPDLGKRKIHTLRVMAYDGSGRKLMVHARTSYLSGD